MVRTGLVVRNKKTSRATLRIGMVILVYNLQSLHEQKLLPTAHLSVN